MNREFYNPNEFKEIMDKHLKQGFEFILNDLGLSQEDLKDKKTLDIGAGERFIAAYCMKEGISSEVYSVEPNMDDSVFVKDVVGKNWPEIKTEIDKKTTRDKRNRLSFEDESFDLVINHAAMPGFGKALKEGDISIVRNGIDKIFNELVRVLKPGGEARIYPIYIAKSVSEEEIKLFKLRDDEVSRKLNELADEGIFSVMIEEVESNNPNRENLQRVIIKRLA